MSGAPEHQSEEENLLEQQSGGSDETEYPDYRSDRSIERSNGLRRQREVTVAVRAQYTAYQEVINSQAIRIVRLTQDLRNTQSALDDAILYGDVPDQAMINKRFQAESRAHEATAVRLEQVEATLRKTQTERELLQQNVRTLEQRERNARDHLCHRVAALELANTYNMTRFNKILHHYRIIFIDVVRVFDLQNGQGGQDMRGRVQAKVLARIRDLSNALDEVTFRRLRCLVQMVTERLRRVGSQLFWALESEDENSQAIQPRQSTSDVNQGELDNDEYLRNEGLEVLAGTARRILRGLDLDEGSDEEKFRQLETHLNTIQAARRRWAPHWREESAAAGLVDFLPPSMTWISDHEEPGTSASISLDWLRGFFSEQVAEHVAASIAENMPDTPNDAQSSPREPGNDGAGDNTAGKQDIKRGPRVWELKHPPKQGTRKQPSRTRTTGTRFVDERQNENLARLEKDLNKGSAKRKAAAGRNDGEGDEPARKHARKDGLLRVSSLLLLG